MFNLFSKKRRRSQPVEDEERKTTSFDDGYGLELLSPGVNPVVDIVAVHGLDGHRHDTWTAENGVLWLKTLLPSDIPQARVFTFGYDARTHSNDQISRDTFYGNAQTLLSDLTLKRRSTETKRRPIIFIAHSLGGLLVKKTLVLSTLTSELHLPHQKDIQLSTFSILFFGTPHQGSNLASWGKIFLRVAGIYTNTDTRLFRHLQSNSESIETGLGEFASIANSILTKYFYETLPTPIKAGSSMMIVEKSSAVPPSTNIESINTRRNHLNMVKFASAAEGLYSTVVQHLSLMLKDAPAVIEQRWENWQRLQGNIPSGADTKSCVYEKIVIRTTPDLEKACKSPQRREMPSLPSAPGRTLPSSMPKKNNCTQMNAVVSSSSTRNAKFNGRRRELEEIHEFLNPHVHRGGQVSFAVHGLGGVGKTQTVKQYFWEYRSDYTLVVWLHASDVATLAQDFSRIAARAEGVSVGASIQIKDIETAREWLVSNPGWLLVFDNLNCMKTFRQFRPICDHGSILITTQDPDIALTASMDLQLRPLGNEEGARLLLSYVKHADQSDAFEQAKLICQELGGLPLAIVHVAGYVRQSQKKLAGFLNEYQAAYSQNVADNKTSLYSEEYERTYSTVWSIALNELVPDARDFIDTLAFFSADKVPEEIFLTDLVPLSIRGENTVNTSHQAQRSQHVDEMIRHLSKRSLIERSHGEDSGSTLTIHRQLQRSLILTLSQDLARSKRIFCNAIKLLRLVFPRQNLVSEHMTKEWPQCARYVDQVLSFYHVYSALPNAADALGYNLEFARILCDCGQYLWEQSLNKSAEQVLQLAEKLCDGDSPPSRPLTLRASILFRQCSVEIDAGYSGILRAIPKFKAATKIQHDALEEMKQCGAEITAEHEIPLANGLNNLGCCYLHLSRYDEAEPLFQESLNIKRRKKWSNNDSMVYEFAESCKNMGIVRAAQNRIDEALEKSLESVRLIAQYTEPKSSRTYFFRFIYACILFDSGNIEQALVLHLEILKARRDILGEAHNYTASSYYMAGFTYYHLGKFSEAEEMIRESIEIWSKGYSRRAHVARAQYLLSLALEAENKFAEATETRAKAKKVLSELTTGLANTEIEENMKAYDSLVPVWNGRSFISKPLVKEAPV